MTTPREVILFVFQIFGNSLADQAGIGIGKVFGDNAPPTRGPKF